MNTLTTTSSERSRWPLSSVRQLVDGSALGFSVLIGANRRFTPTTRPSTRMPSSTRRVTPVVT
ncbi:hypothetical protein [Nocardioides mesophilus]|uniref:hypothetical protein n=1 Tax=Nocardioides mesophilus TaxID=433659 RepID=UPI001FE33CBC|nr:hypothetical protein [Nocardioides mesophilus]